MCLQKGLSCVKKSREKFLSVICFCLSLAVFVLHGSDGREREGVEKWSEREREEERKKKTVHDGFHPLVQSDCNGFL